MSWRKWSAQMWNVEKRIYNYRLYNKIIWNANWRKEEWFQRWNNEELMGPNRKVLNLISETTTCSRNESIV